MSDCGGCECTSVDLCSRLSQKLGEHLQNEKSESEKVSLEDVNKYNDELVHAKDSDEIVLRKLIRHERLYRMMDNGVMSKEKTIWPYLQHYAQDRQHKIEDLTQKVTTP